ncbi:hypothetical protein MCAV_08010 [[Mycoplasma] cavipharyngis]
MMSFSLNCSLIKVFFDQDHQKFKSRTDYTNKKLLDYEYHNLMASGKY